MKWQVSVAMLAVALVAVFAGAQGPTQFHSGFNLFSKEQDVQAGKEYAAEVRKQRTVINDPFLSAYVNRVGQRLVSSREAQQSGFHSPSKWSPTRPSMHSLFPVDPCSFKPDCCARSTTKRNLPA